MRIVGVLCVLMISCQPDDADDSPRPDVVDTDTGSSDTDTGSSDTDTGGNDGEDGEELTGYGAVSILAPNFGYDLGVSAAWVTIEGVAQMGAERVRWTVLGPDGTLQDSGDAALDADGVWSAVDLPLSEGDNQVVIRAVTPDGWSEDDIRVTYYPDNPFVDGLVLSVGAIEVGTRATVDAQIWLEAFYQAPVEVGPSETESWGTLYPSDTPGLYTGTVELDATGTGDTISLRAWADGAASPADVLTVFTPRTEAEEAAAEALRVAVWETLEDAGVDAAVALLSKTAGVDHINQTTHTLGWELDGFLNGIILDDEVDNMAPPMASMAPRGWTLSRGHRAGRAAPRRGGIRTEGNHIRLLTPFDDQFQDAGIVKNAMTATGSTFPGCPMQVEHLDQTSVSPRSYRSSLASADMIHVATHGAALNDRTILASREGWTLGKSRYASQIATGEVFPLVNNGTSYVAITPEYIRRSSSGRARVAFLAACDSMRLTRDPMEAALLSRGVTSVMGYTNIVQNLFAANQSVLYWQGMRASLNHNDALNAITNRHKKDDTTTPALLVESSISGANLTLSESVLADADFADRDEWTLTHASGAIQGMGSIPADYNFSAAEDNATAYAQISPAATYAIWETPYCTSVAVDIETRWQVSASPYRGNWSTDHDNYVLVRAEPDSGSGQTLLGGYWDQIRSAHGNGWQTNTATLDPGTGTLRVVMYGYDADRMSAAIDYIRPQ